MMMLRLMMMPRLMMMLRQMMMMVTFRNGDPGEGV